MQKGRHEYVSSTLHVESPLLCSVGGRSVLPLFYFEEVRKSSVVVLLMLHPMKDTVAKGRTSEQPKELA